MNNSHQRSRARQRLYPSTFAILLAACIGFGSGVRAQENVLKVGGTGGIEAASSGAGAL